MEESIKNKICRQPGCKVSEGGSCLEGIDIVNEQCPHLTIENISSNTLEMLEEKTPSNNKSADSKRVVKLFKGIEMSFSETSVITNNNDSRIIAIVGESKSGKTTLLAEYFIQFQKGTFEEYLFAGSLTQIGFEERCFMATVGYKAKEPDTWKTKSMNFSFLHLALKSKSELHKKPKHFLISDISGERFRDAKTSTVLMKELRILKSADHILFMIDGQKLANKGTRWLAIEDAKTFIQKAIDDKIFDTNTKLKIAVSKWDYIASDDSFNFEDRIVKPFTDKFSHKLFRIEFEKLASRSKNSKIPAGMNLYKLLKSWEDNEIRKPIEKGRTLDDSQRMFQKFSFSK